MNTDCAFRIGRDHAICQDYAVARGGELSFVLLADGCSSSPDTDVGARLLVRAAERRVPSWFASLSQCESLVLEYYQAALSEACRHADALGLDRRSLDATLLTVAADGECWSAALYGDGMLAYRECAAMGGRVRVRSVSFSGGYPDYPSYLLDSARRAAFERLPRNLRQLDSWSITPRGDIEREDGCSGRWVGGCYLENGVTREVEWIAALTDGVGSFSVTDPASRTTSRLPPVEVARDLLAFKSLAGVFVQRRLQRFLRECEAGNRQHHDDLSVGALVM